MTHLWIAGLMAENSDALGFIPITTLQDQYIAQQRYVLQLDECGNKVGYLLHGAIYYGQSVVISQHCIQYEKRLRGYGEMAFAVLLDRARKSGASSIKLRCADDLPAVQFWQNLGFQIRRVVPGGERRRRMIIEMFYPLALPLFREVQRSNL
jgi:GNAT superfamily N-acetyltransferase